MNSATNNDSTFNAAIAEVSRLRRLAARDLNVGNVAAFTEKAVRADAIRAAAFKSIADQWAEHFKTIAAEAAK